MSHSLNTSEIKLLLFLTRGGSLELWARKGILSREIQLYKELQKFGIVTTLLTYGNLSDKQHNESNSGLRVKCNVFNLPLRIYEKIIPAVFWNEMRNVHVVKTNQMNGAIAALESADLWRRPLIARCGYMWSLNLARSKGFDSSEAKYARSVESRVFSQSSVNVLTTQDMANDVRSRVSNSSDCVVIPNFVNVHQFKPDNDMPKETDLLFVGRISQEKNLVSLTETLKETDLTLTVIGDGDRRNLFGGDHRKFTDQVKWIKYMSHESIAGHMNRAKIFVLPSHYEGHPKALIEAMASGMTILGADSPGINNVINHGENGWLCGTSAQDFRESIKGLLNKPELMCRLGDNARRFAKANYSLTSVAYKEAELMRQVVGEY